MVAFVVVEGTVVVVVEVVEVDVVVVMVEVVEGRTLGTRERKIEKYV